ncbi:MAG: DegT/DnrJ/EryC1/StrS family aminotransferase [Elusimicrobia bacterium]|nr:DegT/DnrJ/EryC1/StrS family aminotransferase [Elusimicrobiota bacterium]
MTLKDRRVKINPVTQVRYSYLDRQFADIEPIVDDIRKLVKSGDFTLGAPVAEFEAEFARLIGSQYAVGVGSGTDALTLSLKALGIGPGDEVITAANTFVATAGAIAAAGARIVFVDCDDKFVIDADLMERAITPRTKALLPVQWGGQPADMSRIMDIAARHKIPVLEDACQSIGAEIDGRKCGTWGAAAGFSLHPLKNLNVWGDGGLITTDSQELRDRLILMRNHGMSTRDEYAFYAYNSRLDSLQAVVGLHLIKDFEWITNTRIANAAKLDAALSKLIPRVTLPRRDAGERHVYHLYQFLAQDRDLLCAHLRAHGVEAKVHYPVPLHLQPASRSLGYKAGDFPKAEAQAKTTVTLPVHQHLTAEELSYMISCVEEFYS